jgi:hypothetical protein
MNVQTNQDFNDQTNAPIGPGGQMYPPPMMMYNQQNIAVPMNQPMVPVYGPGNAPGYMPAYGQPIMAQPVMIQPAQPVIQNQPPTQVVIKEKQKGSDNSAACCCAGCLAGAAAILCCCCMAAVASGPHRHY